jgi:Tol biopolymer transport system component
MSELRDLDQLVADWLRADAPPQAPGRVLSASLDRIAGVGQARPWVGPWLDAWSGATPRPRTWFVAVLVIIAMLALVGAAAFVGGQPQPRLPSRVVSNGLIAISANPIDVGGGEVGDIYLMAEGGVAQRIIGSAGDGVAQACPMFSPDGRRLAYGEARASEPVTTFRGVWPVADRAVVVVDLNDHADVSPPTMRVILPADPGEIPCPEWSPGGGQVAFRVGPELWVADVASGQTTVFTVTEAPWGEQGFEWSRDGSMVAVAEPGDIRVVRMDGSAATLISVEAGTPLSLGWTAGDDRIIYILPDPGGDGVGISAADRGGTNDTQLTERTPDSPSLENRFYFAAVSPDGTRVAYIQRTTRCANNSCTGDPERLLTMDTDGSNVIELAIPPGFSWAGLQWSPDGKRLLLDSIDGPVSLAVALGSLASVPTHGELNLEWSGSEVTWQPVFP